MTPRYLFGFLLLTTIPSSARAGASGHWEYPPTYNAVYCPSTTSIPPGGKIVFRARKDSCSSGIPAKDYDTYYDIYNQKVDPPLPQSTEDETFTVTWLVNGVEVGAGTDYEWTAPCDPGTYYVSWTLSNNRVYGDPRKDPPVTAALGSVTVTALPSVNIVSPGCEGEFIADDPNTTEDEARVKAYVTVPAGDSVSLVQLWVDGWPEADMHYVSDASGGFWIYEWPLPMTLTGDHVLTVMAYNSHSCTGSTSRHAFLNPEVHTDTISFAGYSLWNREDGDEPIEAPQWHVTNQTYTKPFAYQAGSGISPSVQMVTTNVPGSVWSRYKVRGTWKNSAGSVIGTPYSTTVDTPSPVAFPASLAHSTTAPNLVMDYTLDQSYDFYVRKCDDSDWCWAGATNTSHPQVFLTFGEPLGPWGTSTNNGPRSCWTSVLSLACQWMPETGYANPGGKLDARKRVADQAYSQAWTTYTDQGTNYARGNDTFDMTTFMLGNTSDCQDMSCWWIKVCNSLGMNGQFVIITGGQEGLRTRHILAVGRSTWGAEDWGFHQVGWYSNVFDACLKLKWPPYGQNDPSRVPQNEDLYGNYERDFWDRYYYNEASWTIPQYVYPISLPHTLGQVK